MIARRMIRFGIPSIDRLLGHPVDDPPELEGNPDRFGLKQPGDAATTSVCIVGRHGTGKSVLALHLASRYLADAHPSSNGACTTKVLYVSTDLTVGKAQQVWKNFNLEHPGARTNPFYPRYESTLPERIALVPQRAEASAALAKYLNEPGPPIVAFIDLAESSAGDDWGFMNRVLAGLSQQTVPRHLLVIDAIEGFETLVGERDAYGARMSRRARIAQVMRLAARRCNVVFVCEESQDGVRLPEEFVTDVVVRLHSVEVNRYSRRTIEFEKVRGQTHARGRHAFTIRKGSGSTTGPGGQWYQDYHRYFVNCDDPEIPNSGYNPNGQSISNEPDFPKHQSYVLAFSSLHFQSRQTMESRSAVISPGTDCAGFGIRYLDEMLIPGMNDTRGIPFGYATALIGEAGTQKTALGHSFLAGCFKQLTDRLPTIITGLAAVECPSLAVGLSNCLDDLPTRICYQRRQKYQQLDESAGQLAKRNLGYKVLERIEERAKWVSQQLVQALQETGAVVLLTTTQDVNAESLASEFAGWLCDEAQVPDTVRPIADDLIKDVLVTRIVCRRIEVHDLSSAVLMHIVQQAVIGARERILEQFGRTTDLARKSIDRVRVVIDDFSTWKEIYPDIRNEPLFLPSLLFYLRRAHVAAVIVDSHAGRPDVAVSDSFDTELRALVDHRLYTWRVQFFGESRIAIASVPPMYSESTDDVLRAAPRSVVRELKWILPSQRKRPDVDPHFELYTGLEEGKPQPVGLEIHLFTETSEFARYVDDLNKFLGELFTPVPNSGSVVRKCSPESYNTLRDLCAVQKNTRLDHTLILPVDEFWSHGRHEGFRSQQPWLDAKTWLPGLERGYADRTEDPFGVFRPGLGPKWLMSKESYRRVEFFEENGYHLMNPVTKAVDDGIDRIPFTWDFGFLLCNFEAWTTSGRRRVPEWVRSPSEWKRVEDIWDSLPKAPGFRDSVANHFASYSQPTVRATWREFLGACKVVADAHNASHSSRWGPFDISLMSAEGLSCLIVEIWVSEAYAGLSNQIGALSRRQWRPSEVAIIKLRSLSVELFLSWLLLVDVLDLSRLGDPAHPFEPVTRAADSNVIAARHWYKSACEAQAATPSEITVPVGLPGHFSVRGDWFLAVASASRSTRLADRALDVLSSRRANFVRLESGLGLPTRTIAIDEDRSGPSLRTRLVSPCLVNDSVLDKHAVTKVAYRDLNMLGERVDQKFHWLWRSAFVNYDLVATLWQKWLVRVATSWKEFRDHRGAQWVSGFEMYDRIRSYSKQGHRLDARKLKEHVSNEGWPQEDKNSYKQFIDSWDWFQGLCESLVTELQQAMGSGRPMKR